MVILNIIDPSIHKVQVRRRATERYNLCSVFWVALWFPPSWTCSKYLTEEASWSDACTTLAGSFGCGIAAVLLGTTPR